MWEKIMKHRSTTINYIYNNSNSNQCREYLYMNKTVKSNNKNQPID